MIQHTKTRWYVVNAFTLYDGFV